MNSGLILVLEDEWVFGSLANAVHHLVDALDLSEFDSHDCHDLAAATAPTPAMLLKAMLWSAQGLISSWATELACPDNALFIAIAGNVVSTQLKQASPDH